MNFKHGKLAATTAVLAILAMVAGSQGNSTKNATPLNVQQAVMARLGEIKDAAEALDADKVFSFVLENDSGAMSQNGKVFLTRQEALESTRQGFDGLQKLSYQFEEQRVTLLSPTVALATGEGDSSATLDDGRIMTARFAQSVILILTNGEWKVFHSHRSFPPAR